MVVIIMSKKITNQEFLNKVQQLYPFADFSKSVYTGCQCKVIVILKDFGEIEVLASTLLSGKWKGGQNKWNTHKFIYEAKKKFSDKNYSYSKVNYINNDTKVTITCPIHGDFEIRPGDFLRQTGCPLCKPKSKREIFISDWLNQNNIQFQHDYQITLSNGKKAAIDFVINNTYVEYNGIQHYKDVKQFGNKQFSFEYQQERDILVQNYCDDNNIKLIWIPYTYTDEEIIKILETFKHGY